MLARDLDYDLPERLIAQQPADQRDAARLLVLDRETQSMAVDTFANVARYLRRGDCLALNESRVIRARLHGAKPTGGKVEIFLLKERAGGEWEALVRPSAKVKDGAEVRISPSVRAIVGAVLPGGKRAVRFDPPDGMAVMEQSGEMPLPPYIRRDETNPSDLTRYQTIYAETPGSVAAPTAGLHFTPQVFESLAAAGVHHTRLTLHVGYGTFKPIQTDDLTQHTLDSEEFAIAAACAATLNATRAGGGRVVAVGTTATRVLESQYRDGAYQPGAGSTDLFIYPPYTFQAVDVLQTNFHLPRSSLLALVCAFAGTDFVLRAYQYAIEHRFRFYSYGDVMLIR